MTAEGAGIFERLRRLRAQTADLDAVAALSRPIWPIWACAGIRR
jgi:hypothetical protein